MPAYSGTQRTTVLAFGIPGQPYGSFANKSSADLTFDWPVAISVVAKPVFTVAAKPEFTVARLVFERD